MGKNSNKWAKSIEHRADHAEPKILPSKKGVGRAVKEKINKKGAVAGVCSCNHRYTNRNSNGESIWGFLWSQEQTPATA